MNSWTKNGAHSRGFARYRDDWGARMDLRRRGACTLKAGVADSLSS